jgi:hypothetical protein
MWNRVTLFLEALNGYTIRHLGTRKSHASVLTDKCYITTKKVQITLMSICWPNWQNDGRKHSQVASSCLNPEDSFSLIRRTSSVSFQKVVSSAVYVLMAIIWPCIWNRCAKKIVSLLQKIAPSPSESLGRDPVLFQFPFLFWPETPADSKYSIYLIFL